MITELCAREKKKLLRMMNTGIRLVLNLPLYRLDRVVRLHRHRNSLPSQGLDENLHTHLKLFVDPGW